MITLKRTKIILGLAILIVCFLVGCNKQFNENVEEVKIYIEHDSLYTISFSQLKNLGFDINKDENIRLTNKGLSIPFWIDNTDKNDSQLIFWGIRDTSSYYSGNFYLLEKRTGESRRGSWANEKVIVPSDIKQEETTNTGRTVINLEKNVIYLPEAVGNDHWYWKSLSPSNHINIEFDLPGLQKGQLIISCQFWSGFSDPDDIDHHLVVDLNGHRISDHSWEGTGQEKVEIFIPSDMAIEKGNLLRIELLGSSLSSSDQVYLDLCRIEYSRKLVENDGKVEFIAIDNVTSIAGINDEYYAIDLTDNKNPLMVDEQLSIDRSLILNTIPGHKYLVIEKKNVPSPREIMPISEIQRFSNFNDGNYVIIAPENLIKVLNPLVDYRRTQGYGVIIFPIADIYDRFSFGIPDPMAVNSFLKWASREWRNKPSFVLLIGDSSYDLMSFIKKKDPNWLPPLFYDSIFGGETITDIPLADLDDDGLPDLALGRLPFSNPTEIKQYIENVINYETTRRNDTDRNSGVGIIGENEEEFGNAVDKFAEALHQSSKATDPFTKQITFGYESSREMINAGMNDWLIYFGHGALQRWGREGILQKKGLDEAFVNGTSPIMVNFSCLTGYFIHPEYPSITEQLLVLENGPVAVVAPTSLTLSDTQVELSTVFGHELSLREDDTIGELWLSVQQKFPIVNSKNIDVLHTFLLFGDPAVTLP